MKNITNILFIITISLFALVNANSQISTNSGTIVNFGTINIKTGAMENENTGLVKNFENGRINIDNKVTLISDGKIENTGTIYSLGLFNFKQDSINGDVIYDNNGALNPKQIKNASYFNVKFIGDGEKLIRENKSVEVRNMLYTDGSSIIKWPQGSTNVKFILHDTLNHNGLFNPNEYGSRFVLASSDKNKAQTVIGSGKANELELNNSLGADIYDTTAGNTNKDGLKINHLILTNGELRNSPSANITIGGSALWGSSTTLSYATGTITRSALGSIKSEPNMPTKVDLYYVGGATEPLIASGNEIPQVQTDKINDLNVINESGVKLTSSATVNNKLSVKSALYTYQRDADTVINEKELVINSQVDPEYLQDTAEVHGRMTRTNFDPTKSLLFNNKYTFLKFMDPAISTGGLKRLSMNIKPNIAYDDIIRKGTFRVQRQLEISGDTITEGTNRKDLALASGILETTFGWRYDAGANPLTNEVSSALELKKDKLTFQYWNGIAWKDNKTSSLLSNGNWGQTKADLGYNGFFGEFGVGAPAQTTLEILAKVILEGPFKYGSLANDVMFTDLRDSNMVPLTPPAIYPYILDTNRALHFVTKVPKNIVDWVVIEFRDKAINADKRYFRTCFLRKDGRLVDLDGISDVAISQQFTQDTNRNPIDTSGKTQYYVAIRHRNHVTLMSQNTLQFTLEGQSALFDFTSPSFVWGGNSAIKLVGFDANKNKVFAAAAGNYSDPNNNKLRSNYFTGISIFGIDNEMDLINDKDKTAVWDFMQRGDYSQGYILEDYNLDGIVTTKDFNISWNNRTRLGSIK